MAASFWPATKACAAAWGDSVVVFTSLRLMPFLLSIHADGLAFEICKALDIATHRNAVGAVGLVHLEDLHDGHAVGVPGHMRLDRSGSALDGLGGQGQVAVLL